ncbi:hypothetical protein MRX96_046894 [Rhipicephalus microplus]
MASSFGRPGIPNVRGKTSRSLPVEVAPNHCRRDFGGVCGSAALVADAVRYGAGAAPIKVSAPEDFAQEALAEKNHHERARKERMLASADD